MFRQIRHSFFVCRVCLFFFHFEDEQKKQIWMELSMEIDNNLTEIRQICGILSLIVFLKTSSHFLHLGEDNYNSVFLQSIFRQ